MNPSEFIKQHGGRRIDGFDPMSFKSAMPDDPKDKSASSDLEFERSFDNWQAISPDLPVGWRSGLWTERPLRFVDGCDKGDTVFWMRAPMTGEPIPVRLSQIGAAVVEVQDRKMRRVWSVTEKVVSFVADAFDWEEIEGFARALAAAGFRLLLARPDGGCLLPDFEPMRKAAQNRSNEEMVRLEEAALAWSCEVPTIVDGRLEPRGSGFNAKDNAVVGVVKTHHTNYLHPAGLGLLYLLEVGQRTPVFRRMEDDLKVVSWYVRLSGELGCLPNSGYVRVEVAWRWFADQFGESDKISDQGIAFVNALSRLIYDYRCRDSSYSRAAISLEPIVCVEQKMSALLLPSGPLLSRFYRVCDL